jgi:hypothetical protein
VVVLAAVDVVPGKPLGVIPWHSVHVLYPPEYLEMSDATSWICVDVSTFPKPTIWVG